MESIAETSLRGVRSENQWILGVNGFVSSGGQTAFSGRIGPAQTEKCQES
jgi:hypothetical protein